MSRTLTALFDTRADAEAAQSRLIAANVGADHVRLHDQASHGYGDIATTPSTRPNTGIWASIKNAFLPDEDRSVYEEGLRRGGTLLTADVSENEVDEAIRVLEDSNGIDMDSRTGDWHASGWTAPAIGAAAGMATTPTLEPDTDRDLATARTDAFVDRADRAMTTGTDQVIPVVEEQLRVGKREVARGGARVRSYMVETPVNEQVRLREENVSVERRAVDLPVSSTDGDIFRERNIELTETAEEAVISKEARVREEVVLRKDVGERVQDVTDSVRHTEVEIERMAAGDTLRDTRTEAERLGNPRSTDTLR